jgi:hypothetical protein
MAIASMALFEKAAEFLPIKERGRIPSKTRGIYILLKQHRRKRYEVVYVGMVGGPSAGIRGRLRSHYRKKPAQWTHFSVFKVWDNISQQAVRELEGIVRHVFRKDPRVNPLAVQRGFKPLKKLARDKEWLRQAGSGQRRKKKSP